ncbi:MAG: Hpt domain-containing protein [Spirochaetales bacterium]|nr:Hpt domain-containing protein [Spirochaetales bacterium]
MDDVFNKEKAARHTADDLGLLKELLTFTLEDVPVMLKELEELSWEETDKAAQIAHKIKGSAGAVSGEKLFAAAFELEETAKEGDSSRLEELYLFMCESFNEFKDDRDVKALLA